jgi:hypothetical protein
MFPHNKTRPLAAVAFVLMLSLASPAVAAAKDSKKKKSLPEGTAVLWREPSNIRSRDLFEGPGGERMRPDVRRLTFLKEEKGGWSKKFRVRDAEGREWVAKLGKESQSETAAVRLVWAVGYETEINYLIPRVTIPGKGTFENVRFEARPEGIKRLDEWKWKSNPFKGTRELEGLKVLMALINNWDMKDANNVILYAPGGRDARAELRYAISDLGATFGKAAGPAFFWRITRSRNNPEEYADSKFIDKVKRGYVDFHFVGKNRELLDKIRVEDARWIGGLLSRLSERQLADAFRAANYTTEEIRTLTTVVRSRIDELVRLPRAAR